MEQMDSTHKGPEIRSFDIFPVDNPNQLLNKQSSCLLFKTPWNETRVVTVI